ncbi:phosphatidylinositol-4-phosphate 5-kinase-like protein [Pycnococcus provasolii]
MPQYGVAPAVPNNLSTSLGSGDLNRKSRESKPGSRDHKDHPHTVGGTWFVASWSSTRRDSREYMSQTTQGQTYDRPRKPASGSASPVSKTAAQRSMWPTRPWSAAPSPDRKANATTTTTTTSAREQPTWLAAARLRRNRSLAAASAAFSSANNPIFDLVDDGSTSGTTSSGDDCAQPAEPMDVGATAKPANDRTTVVQDVAAAAAATAIETAESREETSHKQTTAEVQLASTSSSSPESSLSPGAEGSRKGSEGDAFNARAELAEKLSVELARRLRRAEAELATCTSERDAAKEELAALRQHVSRDRGIMHGERVDGADVYEGFLSVDGKTPQYFGVCRYGNGDRYQGSWRDGVPDGFGTCTFALGNRYVGGWKQGGYHGDGTYTYTNGDVYQGTWCDDARDGDGVLTEANGTAWVEQYEKGRLISRDTWDSLAAEFAASPSSSPSRPARPEQNGTRGGKNGTTAPETTSAQPQPPARGESAAPASKAPSQDTRSKLTPNAHEELKNKLRKRLVAGELEQILQAARETHYGDLHNGVKTSTPSSPDTSPPASQVKKPSFMRSSYNPIGASSASSPDSSDNSSMDEAVHNGGGISSPNVNTPMGMTDSEKRAHEERRRRLDLESSWRKDYKKARWRDHVSRARSHLEKAYEEFKGHNVPFARAPPPSPIPEFRKGAWSQRDDGDPFDSVKATSKKALDQHIEAFEAFESTMCTASSTRAIRFDDIPWPPRAALAGIADSIGAKGIALGVVGPNSTAHRKLLLRLKSRWHPDKWQGRRLHEPDRARIMSEVTAVFQAVHSLRKQCVTH